MKTLFVALCLICIFACAGATEAPVPRMPEEVTLTTGRVLRKVQVVRWERERVVIKHSAGADPIPFSLFSEPLRSSLPAIRDAYAQNLIKEQKASRLISGQVFIATNAAGSYKFGAVRVLAVPLSALAQIQERADSEVRTAYAKADERRRYHSFNDVRAAVWTKALADITPIASTMTDAEGNFRLELPSKESAFLFCYTYRGIGPYGEHNLWAVPIKAGDRIDLNNENQM